MLLRFPLTRYERVTVVDFSKCSSKSDACDRMSCPETGVSASRRQVLGLTDEVCGNDGVTYPSMCHLHKSTCTKGTQLAHQGPCATQQLTQAMKRRRKTKCPDIDCPDVTGSPVCGSDGNVYKYPMHTIMQKSLGVMTLGLVAAALALKRPQSYRREFLQSLP